MNVIVNINNKSIGAETNSVNAKELHKFLESKTQYSHWITRRIKKYGFIENQDYIVILTKKDGNNATLKEYYITIDMAKELSMVENNEKGREARRWFIEIAKQHLNQTNPHQIAGYKSQLAQKDKQISQLQARVMQLEDPDCIASTITRALQDAHEYRKVKKIIQGN